MRHTDRHRSQQAHSSRAFVCLIGLVVLSTLACASPQPASAAVARDEVRCRAGLGKATMRVTASVLREVERCHKARMRGSEPATTDCNDPATLAPESLERIARMRDKLAEAATDRCAGASSAFDNGYWVCRTPCQAVVITGYDDVAACLACSAENAASTTAGEVLGMPSPAGAGTQAAKCHVALGKAMRKYGRKRMKAQRKCQLRQDRGLVSSAIDCRVDDAGGRLTKAAATAARLVARCSDAALGELDSCAGSVAAEMTCLRDFVEAEGDGVFRSAMHRVPEMEPFETKLASLTWLMYAPSNFNPTLGCPAGFPSEASIRADLQIIRAAGFTGIITSAADCTLEEIPRIAREEGFEGVIMGMFLFTPVLREEEIANALAESEHADAFGIGNEELIDCGGSRYDQQTLLETMLTIRDATGKPVASSEQIEDYIDGGGCLGGMLLDKGDWLFPITHPFNNGIIDPLAGIDFTVGRHAELSTLTTKPILHKETGWPTGLAPGASEANQETYFVGLKATVVPFAYFEYRDQEWKSSPPHEARWGLWRSDGTPKLFIANNDP